LGFWIELYDLQQFLLARRHNVTAGFMPHAGRTARAQRVLTNVVEHETQQHARQNGTEQLWNHTQRADPHSTVYRERCAFSCAPLHYCCCLATQLLLLLLLLP